MAPILNKYNFKIQIQNSETIRDRTKWTEFLDHKGYNIIAPYFENFMIFPYFAIFSKKVFISETVTARAIFKKKVLISETVRYKDTRSYGSNYAFQNFAKLAIWTFFQ